MAQKEKDEALLWATTAAKAALSKKASNVIAIEVKPTLVILDYFVVASADNALQLKAVVDEVEKEMLNQHHLKPRGREGAQGTNWVLLDFGDIVVHVFTPETRDFYRLESLYNDAKITTFEDREPA